MFNLFTTKYSIAHPISYFNSNYFYHPIGILDEPQNMVCQFGKDAAILLISFIILRTIFIIYLDQYKINYKYLNKSILKYTSIFVVTLAFILSLMNFNVIVYLIPYFIMEYYIIKGYL